MTGLQSPCWFVSSASRFTLCMHMIGYGIRRVLSKHKAKMGGRYVEIFESTANDLQRALDPRIPSSTSAPSSGDPSFRRRQDYDERSDRRSERDREWERDRASRDYRPGGPMPYGAPSMADIAAFAYMQAEHYRAASSASDVDFTTFVRMKVRVGVAASSAGPRCCV